MGTLTSDLLNFHQLTLRLYTLNQQIDSQRRRMAVQERRLAEHAEQAKGLLAEITRAQASAHEAEMDLRARDATLEKLRGQLNAAKTNKEYSAILREINSFKAEKSRAEEEALRRMGAVDELKGKRTELEATAEDERKRLAELKAHAEGRVAELAEQVRQVEHQRRLAAETLPGEVVVQFNRVAEAHDGEAMAPILKPNPKREEYICGGCNMGVTLEQVNALHTREDVQICNVCGRMLYLE